jgi:5'-nucleotidase
VSAKSPAPARKPVLLLTNDDGFIADGLQVLRRALRGLGEIWIVAPDREKSACSLSLTLHRPLRVQKSGPRGFAVDGTPADCVYLAVRKLLPRAPDLLLSGINRGPNLGQQDIAYSGTVAAAVQGTFLGIPSVAVSLSSDAQERYSFEYAARLVRPLAAYLLAHRLQPGTTLNVNVPPPPCKGARVTDLGQKRYTPEIVEKKDPRENSYFWIGTGRPQPSGGPTSDIRAVAAGFLSLTPLHKDMTDHQAARGVFFRRLASGISGDAGRTRRR